MQKHAQKPPSKICSVSRALGNMKINCAAGIIELINEPSYSFSSNENSRSYIFAKNLDSEFRTSSAHGILLNEKPLAVFGDGGGASCVHPHSAIFLNGLFFFAVGRHVVCVCLEPFKFLWALQTDEATCFGVHYNEMHDALISHGELEISRFDQTGAKIWSSSGADVFSEEIELNKQFVEAQDFSGKKYYFNYDTGKNNA